MCIRDSYVFSTSAKGRDPKRDSVRLRRKAVELSIPCITAVDTANALVLSLIHISSSGPKGSKRVPGFCFCTVFYASC